MVNTYPEQSYTQSLLMFSVGSVLLATFVYKATGSTFLHNIFNKKHDNDQPPDEKQPNDKIPFEDKYFKEYDEWTSATDMAANQNIPETPAAVAHRKECLENMYYSTVRETINDFYGDIIMCYDAATFSFAYYARTANIPYKYLETVSRKYMIETNAPRDIHVDIRKEYAKAKEQQTKKTTTTTDTSATRTSSKERTEQANDNDTDVFAKFKPYNTAPNISTNTNQNPNIQTTTTTNGSINKKLLNLNLNQSQNQNASTDTSTKIIRENANRYSYRGKISCFDTHHATFLAHRRAAATTATGSAQLPKSEHSQEEKEKKKEESYAEYKKRMAETMRSAL